MNKILFIWGVQGVGCLPRVCWSYLRVLSLFAVHLSLHLLQLCFHQAQEEAAVEPQKKVRESGKDGVQVGFSLGLKLVCLTWRDPKLPAWIGPGFQTYVYVFFKYSCDPFGVRERNGFDSVASLESRSHCNRKAEKAHTQGHLQIITIYSLPNQTSPSILEGLYVYIYKYLYLHLYWQYTFIIMHMVIPKDSNTYLGFPKSIFHVCICFWLNI